MLRLRNDTTHIYNEKAAQELVEKILQTYIEEFCGMQKAIVERYGDVEV